MNAHTLFQKLETLLSAQILGQSHLMRRLSLCLLADGHLLVEGAPGLAKTRAIRALADLIEADFARIQFTPDLLPADITGTEIYKMNQGEFEFQPGPLFHHFVLADEINRAPAKVQSALLEAMAERQVSVGKVTRSLPELFLVMATQNPIEQEGTYSLPEAQLDRFLMHVLVDYPSKETELKILNLVHNEQKKATEDSKPVPSFLLSQNDIFQARKQVLEVHMSEAINDYIIRLSDATRHSKKSQDTLLKTIDYGVSPRASLALSRLSRALAWLEGRDFVSPDDVVDLVGDVFRHRIILSYEAESEGISKQEVIDHLIQSVAP